MSESSEREILSLQEVMLSSPTNLPILIWHCTPGFSLLILWKFSDLKIFLSNFTEAVTRHLGTLDDCSLRVFLKLA